jgi:Fe-S oxidoreductase
MKAALLVPCYIDQLSPQVGTATLDVLERYGVEVEFPVAQTCCGQPLLNFGCFAEARPLAEHALATFSGCQYVVCPSASCTAIVRHHYERLRCGACMNTCPVFRRSGGHSYGSTVPGPIGSILEPARAPDRHSSLHGGSNESGGNSSRLAPSAGAGSGASSY